MKESCLEVNKLQAQRANKTTVYLLNRHFFAWQHTAVLASAEQVLYCHAYMASMLEYSNCVVFLPIAAIHGGA